MKLLIPVFKGLPIDSGGNLRNPKVVKKLDHETDLLVKIWKGFEVLDEKRISFNGQFSKYFFLSQIFSESTLNQAGVASVEFDLSQFSEPAKILPVGALEVQFLLKSKLSPHRASVLFDLIPDKNPGHKYTPILHAGHSAWVDTETDSYAVLLNFRPPFLKTDEKQKLRLQARNARGEILSEREIEVSYNETTEISYKKEFEKVGGFSPGCTLNFAGGSSQFAIFTVFTNQKTHALGIEHSLPPYYYCSGVFEPQNRVKFYQRAFADLRI